LRSTEFVVVAGPDHPLLLREADLLVAGRGTITALFTPSAAERRVPSLLRSRLILNRLALPPHTRCILIAEIDDSQLMEAFEFDFARVIEWGSQSELVSIAQNPRLSTRHVDVQPELTVHVQHQFAKAMTAMRLVARLTRIPFSSAFGERFGEQPSPKTRPPPAARIIRHKPPSDQPTVPLAEFSDGVPARASVMQLINEQTERQYGLDNGVLFWRERPPGIALIDTWPSGPRHDPGKLIHAAAFGGWAFVLKRQPEILSGLSERLRRER
jgi:hypothetical protein